MKVFLGLLSVIFPIILFAQETIDVQRPTLTESNTTIAKNIIQFESGFTLDESKKVGFGTFVRFGATEKLEFRLYKELDYTFHISGKVMMYEGRNLLPGIAITMSYDPIYHYQDYRVCFSGSKGDFFYTLNGANNGIFYGIALLGISMGNASLFGEYQINEYTQHQFNGGITYIVKNEVQIDMHGGVLRSGVETSPFVGAGVSFRVK